MTRWIDDIIKEIENHPYISSTHKRLLINRVKKLPTKREINQAIKDIEKETS